METEEKVFAGKRFSEKAATDYGFVKEDGGYIFKADFLDGDFTAIIKISDGGKASGIVIDNMNGEEYRQLRTEAYQGSYVNTVRNAYEELLEKIAANCFNDVLFASDQANRIAGLIEKKFGILPDYPWDEGPHNRSGVFRHKENAKWFALIMNVKRSVVTKTDDDVRADVMNLKALPREIGKLTEKEGIFPAYHMNKKNWISVLLDGTLADDEVMAMVRRSFILTC